MVNLDGKWWIQSSFRCMGFVRRTATTSTVKIPEGVQKEAGLVYLHTVVSTIEKYQIPKSMVLNLDQTPLKYAPCIWHTLEKRNAKHVAIAGTSYKKAITGTFVITLEGKCLPFQLIYGGKTSESFIDISLWQFEPLCYQRTKLEEEGRNGVEYYKDA